MGQAEKDELQMQKSKNNSEGFVKSAPTKAPSVFSLCLDHVGFRDWMKNGPHILRTLANGEVTNRPEPIYACDICGKSQSYIELVHQGKFRACHRHPRLGINHPPPEGFVWKDIMQMSLCHAVISEIKKCSP